MGIDAEAKAAFVDTMERWQATGGGNIEEEFGAKVASAFPNPPYYAALVKPAMQSTYGGVRTDASRGVRWYCSVRRAQATLCGARPCALATFPA